jgi:hypothetical protein
MYSGPMVRKFEFLAAAQMSTNHWARRPARRIVTLVFGAGQARSRSVSNLKNFACERAGVANLYQNRMKDSQSL